MDNDDNYVWDRSGEADPEIQQLEETLGALRYQPQPLRIPAHLQIQRRRFGPLMAIAAAMALVAIALGLWFAFKQRRAAPSLEVNQKAPPALKAIENQQPNPQPKGEPEQAFVNPNFNPRRSQKRHREPAHTLQARANVPTPAPPRLTPAELAQKEQVLVALRLLSVKLNVAQRKAQSLPAPNSIRNQHKIG